MSTRQVSLLDRDAMRVLESCGELGGLREQILQSMLCRRQINAPQAVVGRYAVQHHGGRGSDAEGGSDDVQSRGLFFNGSHTLVRVVTDLGRGRAERRSRRPARSLRAVD